MGEYSDKLVEYCNKNDISYIEIRRELNKDYGIPISTSEKWFSTGKSKREPSKESKVIIQRFLVDKEGKTTDDLPGMFATPSIDSAQKLGGISNNAEGANEMAHIPNERVMTITKKETPVSRLNDEQIEALLKPHEVVRDPVIKDITITALERRIIDTEDFQRLRGLRQLGPTYLVYPGAEHNRFMHSLGTLYHAEQLVQIANRNHNVYKQPYILKIEPYPHLLTRLYALLHDIAHMPFGHTLEDEGNLSDPEWDDQKRAGRWFGPDSEIVRAIRDFFSEAGYDHDAAEKLVEDIRKYILYKGNPFELEYPFVTDIVGNTLCADLLDYLDRDMYFCGLRERCGDRVIKYLAVININILPKDETGTARLMPNTDTKNIKGRFVLLAYRIEKQHFAYGEMKKVQKIEILSEAIDLLRRRFALAEKVYFHRTKLAASAMLISAMGSAATKLEEIYSVSDDKFLDLLLHDANPRAKHLAEAYSKRRLYKPVYKINYREECEEDPQSRILWQEKYDYFRSPQWRKSKEELIESISELHPGSVAIYCPERGMNLKEFEMLVQIDPQEEIKKLGSILDDIRKQEMDAINNRFERLWSLSVFVDPQVLDVSQVSNEKVQDLSKLCESKEFIGFPNDVIDLQGKGRDARDQIAQRAINKYQLEHGTHVPFDAYKELVTADHRKEGADLVEAIKSHLEALMKEKNWSAEK